MVEFKRTWLAFWVFGATLLSGCSAFGWGPQPDDTLTPPEQAQLGIGCAGAYAPEPTEPEDEPAYEPEDEDAGVGEPAECIPDTYEIWAKRVIIQTEACGRDKLHCCGQPGLDGDHYRPVCVDLCALQPGTVAMGNTSGTSVRCVADWDQCAP
jgi:hypothetical protein